MMPEERSVVRLAFKGAGLQNPLLQERPEAVSYHGLGGAGR